MPNEVEITITANDLTGPAFASALAKIEALKRAAGNVDTNPVTAGINTALMRMSQLRSEIDKLSFGKIDSSELGSSLVQLKSKIQSLGIADIADVNIPPGRIMTQLQFLKRMVGQSGISDMLDINVNDSSLQKQLQKIGDLTEVIPVDFRVDKLPKFGPTQDVINIPVNFDMSKIPQFGDVSVIDAAAAATARLIQEMQDANSVASDSQIEFGGLNDNIDRYIGILGEGARYNAGFGDSFSYVYDKLHNLDVAIGAALYPLVRDLDGYITGAVIPGLRLWGQAADDLANRAIGGVTNKISGLSDSISNGERLWGITAGQWGILGGKAQLFGGALSHSVLPAFLGTVGGLHLMTDGIIELAATLIPATVALGAFAVGAIDQTQIIYNHFVNMDKAIDETGQSVYPLTGAFTRLQDAVKPEVYTLVGEGLYIINKNAGFLQPIAVSAGKALDDLGARFTYAMTTGQGFAIFTRNAAKDLAGWGTFIGNLGGIIGNFLRVMPGYAEAILNAANATTHFVEVTTGSRIGESILAVGLAAHGALIYIGLLGTGVSFLISRTLPVLSRLSLGAGSAIEKLGGSSNFASNGLLSFAAGADRASKLPWGWITLAAAAFGVLVYELMTAKDAAAQFGDSMNKAVSQATLVDLNNTISGAIQKTSEKLQGQVALMNQVAIGQSGVIAQLKDILTFKWFQANPLAQQVGITNEYATELRNLQQQQSLVSDRLGQLSHMYGGTANALSLMNAAGITASQVTDTNNQHWAQALIEIQAQDDAIRALSDGTGRYAAALNALSGPQQYLGDTLKNIQQITQAQDNLITTVTEGATAFDTFGTGQATLIQDFNSASGAINGLNNAGYTLNLQYYTQVAAAQKVIDALEQQEIGTGNLTTATATLVSQLIPFAGHSDATRATLVALINDALGPGTVSLQDLNSWVKNNSTSLVGLNNIIDQSTVKAGTLANVLQQQLNQQFQQDLVRVSGAQQALAVYTRDIVNNTTATAKGRNDRNILISDLEKTGMNAKTAAGFVNGLQTQINQMHGKSVNVSVNASAKGAIEAGIKANGGGFSVQQTLELLSQGFSTGGRLPGFGGGDRNLAMLEDGEAVIDKYRTRQLAPLFRALGIPGFEQGGIAGVPGWVAGVAGNWAGSVMQNWATNQIQDFINSFMANPISGGGSLTANQMIARSIMPQWASGTNWSSLVALWNRESGWNQYAMNPTSGAYGIPQALPLTKMPRSAWPASMGGTSNPYSQEQWGEQYIAGTYGSPTNAWAHEVNFGWYDDLNWIKPGMNVMMNGTGRNELLANVTDGICIDVCLSVDDSFHQLGISDKQLEAIRYTVKMKGGKGPDSVQRALGQM